MSRKMAHRVYIYIYKWKDVFLHIIYVNIKLLHTIINININFMYKINLKNKTFYIQGVPF